MLNLLLLLFNLCVNEPKHYDTITYENIRYGYKVEVRVNKFVIHKKFGG